jgi:class 3 adenylate cyclase
LNLIPEPTWDFKIVSYNTGPSFIDRPKSQADDESFFAYFLFVDVVGSSIATLDIKQQIHKLESFYSTLRDILRQMFYPDVTEAYEPRYWNLTGDGAVFCFTKPLDPFRLSIALRKELERYNIQKSLQSEKIELRIGISGGATLDVKQTNGKSAPWGRGMIVARRIMDMARPNQILCSEWMTNDVKLFNPSFRFYNMGEHTIKWGDRVAVSSFLYEDEEIKLDNATPVDCDCTEHATISSDKV